MNRRKILLIVAIVVLAALFFALGFDKRLTIEALEANRQALLDRYATHRLATVGIFLALYIAQTALSLPGAAILSLAAGAIFGAFMGTVYAVIGATLGSTAAFLVTRYLFHEAVQRAFGRRLNAINRELEAEGLYYLLFLRLVPIFPFFLVNLGAALTRLPLRTFLYGTLIGIIPGGFVYCNAGASLGAIDRIGDIATPRVLGSFALLGLFSLLPVIHTKFTARKRS